MEVIQGLSILSKLGGATIVLACDAPFLDHANAVPDRVRSGLTKHRMLIDQVSEYSVIIL